MQWISIKYESPPHDGTPFLCYDPACHEYGKIYVVRYEPENSYKFGIHEINTPASYVEASGEGYDKWIPTHWMPLPEGPNEVGKCGD